MFKVCLLLSVILLSVKTQIPEGNAINTCGTTIGNNVPKTKEECKDEKKGVNCCYIKVTFKDGDNTSDIQFCSIIPGKLNSDVKDEVKNVLSASEVTIDCNNGKYLTMYFSLVFLLVFIVF